MSTGAEFFFAVCGLAILSVAITAVILWHDIKKENQQALDRVNAEYKDLVEDERRRWAA